MENNSTYPAWKHALTYGVVISVILFLYSNILYLLDLSMNKNLGYIAYVFIIVGLVLSMLQYRNKYAGGIISYGKSFNVGFLTGIFVAIFGAIFSFIFIKFIATDLPGLMLEEARKGVYETRPNISDEEMEMAMGITSKFLTAGGMALVSVLYYVFFSLVVSLIASIFIKKESN